MIFALIIIGLIYQNYGADFSQISSAFSEFWQSPFAKFTVVSLVFSSSILTVFIVYEALVRRDHYLYSAIVVLVLFGLAAALPYYLFIRMPKGDR